MVVVAGFKIVVCHSNVDSVRLVMGGYRGSVHKAGSQDKLRLPERSQHFPKDTKRCK